ncbi:MAG: hypothetical protein QOE46_263 [Acidobacteriota bacterium]|nr:hypothetical protein [Acidobacteriota bacterium]
MLRIILPLLALLLVASPARAFVSQSPAGAADAKAQAKTGADKYVELLDKLKKGDRTVDFRELRMTYTETKDYNPYGNDRAERQAMFAALSNKKWDEVLKHSEKMLEKNYVDLNAHYGAYVAQREKGNAEKADFHKFVLTGLVDSIRGKGDGKSMEQAFVVISCV